MRLWIRERRKALGLTQEQIAQALGVTAPAVSKWEQGATYPDVTLLPALARLLQTDLDTLFGFSRQPDQQEMAQAVQEVALLAQRDAQAGLARAQELIREYPNSGALLYSLAATMQGILVMTGVDPQTCGAMERTLEEWLMRAADSADAKAQAGAAFLLAGKYMGEGELERAREMIDRLPEESAQKRWAMEANWLIAKGERRQAEKLYQRKLLDRVMDIQLILLKLAETATADGDGERAEKLAQICAQFAQAFGMTAYHSALPQLQIAVSQRDVRRSVALLRQMLRAMDTPWHMEASVLYDRVAPESGGTMEKMKPGILMELSQSPEYDFLREDEEFRELMAEYGAP